MKLFSFGRRRVLRKQGGLAQQHFNVGELRDLLVALPVKNEQDRIVDRLIAIASHVQSEDTKLDKLRLLKSGLMHDLLTGRVRIPESMLNKAAVAT